MRMNALLSSTYLCLRSVGIAVRMLSYFSVVYVTFFRLKVIAYHSTNHQCFYKTHFHSFDCNDYHPRKLVPTYLYLQLSSLSSNHNFIHVKTYNSSTTYM